MNMATDTSETTGAKDYRNSVKEIVGPAIVEGSMNGSKSTEALSLIVATDRYEEDHIALRQKPYTLNKPKALMKKLDHCNREDIKITSTSSDNYVIKMNSGSFEGTVELIKQILNLDGLEQSDKRLIQITVDKDLEGVLVSGSIHVKHWNLIAKPSNCKLAGKCNFVINIYRTTSTILVNGRDSSTFIELFDPYLDEYLKLNAAQISETNTAISEAISNIRGTKTKHQHDKEEDTHKQDNMQMDYNEDVVKENGIVDYCLDTSIEYVATTSMRTSTDEMNRSTMQDGRDLDTKVQHEQDKQEISLNRYRDTLVVKLPRDDECSNNRAVETPSDQLAGGLSLDEDDFVTLRVPSSAMPKPGNLNKPQFIVNELLCYIQNKIDTEPTETVINMAKHTFPYDEIHAAKIIIYKLVPLAGKRLRTYRGENKSFQDLHDIILHFHTAQLMEMPIFLSMDLSKLPPLTSASNDLIAVLRRQERMQAEVRTINETQQLMAKLLTTKLQTPLNATHLVDTHKYDYAKFANTKEHKPGTIEICADSSSSDEDDSLSTSSVDTSDGDKIVVEVMQRNEDEIEQHSKVNNQEQEETVKNNTDRDDEQKENDKTKRSNSDEGEAKDDETDAGHSKVKNDATYGNLVVTDDDMGGLERDVLHVSANPTHQGADLLWSTVVRRNLRAREVGRGTRVRERVYTSSNKQNTEYRIRGQTGPKNIVYGSGNANGIRAASQPTSKSRSCTGIFLTRLHASCCAKDIDAHVKKETGLAVNSEKLKTKYETYSSFYIRCDGREKNALMDGQVWPTGALIKPYFS